MKIFHAILILLQHLILHAYSSSEPAKITECMEFPQIITIIAVLDPPEIIRGQQMTFKALGQMRSDQMITNLHLVTLHNGIEIYVNNKDMGRTDAKKGSWFLYDYTATIPSDVPLGLWEVVIFLQNQYYENISCMKILFNWNNSK